MSTPDIPEVTPKNDEYVSRTGQKDANVPVASDDEPVQNEVNREEADSDVQLGTWSASFR